MSSGRAGLAIVLVALGVRLAWILVAQERSGGRLELPDEKLHWQLASNLALRGELISDDGRYAARMPLYPLFLAPFAVAGDVGLLLARVAQAMIAAATVWALWLFVSRAIGDKAALTAGVIAALDPYGVFFANLLLTEALFTAVLVSLVAAFWWLKAAPGISGALLCGLLCCAAILTRPSSAALILILWTWLLAGSTQRQHAVRHIGVMALLVAAGLLPWGLRNQAVLGDFAWLSTNGGVTLYDAQGPQANGASDQRFVARLGLEALGEVQRDQVLQRYAIEEMQRDPLRVVRLGGVKFLRTWGLFPNADEYRTGWRDLASAVFSGGVYVAAIAGVFALRKDLRLLALLLLPVVYFTLIHCVYVGSLRYRVPLMPMLEILAAAGLASIWHALRATAAPPPASPLR